MKENANTPVKQVYTSTVPTENEINSYMMIAKVAASNPHWRKLGGSGSEESVIATILSVMLLARELGFSPMQSISGGINNIQGKFEISARLMNQSIRARGHKMKIVTLTDEVCKIWGQRRDTLEEMEVFYHIEEAKRSGLVRDGGPWKKVPQDMLFARALSRLARRLYPDCIGGCYIEGELQETMQGKIVDIPPSYDKQEFNGAQQPVNFILPDDINGHHVDLFIRETAKQNNKTEEDIRKRAMQNLDGFLQVFKKWEEAQFSSLKEEINVAV